MSDLLDTLKAAEQFYWEAMDLVTGDGVHRVRCRYCQMVKDMGEQEDPKSAFMEIEHYARKCPLVSLDVAMRKALARHR